MDLNRDLKSFHSEKMGEVLRLQKNLIIFQKAHVPRTAISAISKKLLRFWQVN